MARNKSTEIELTAYDDLFQTDESREEAKLSKIRDIPISEIDEFPDHPFKVLIDEDMEQLVESIKRNGVMTPATVRLKEDGRYELISGHRRRKACELAGLETLKCEVKDLSRDEAIIIMVESNLQRSTILPSEKAFAYKMRLEAMKRQAGRPTKDNYSPMGNNLEFATSSDELAEKVGESKNQIFRFYLWLNPCGRYDYARLRYCADWSFPQISRPVPESKRLFDPCRRRHHYLCKRDFDSYHRLISDNKKTQDRAYGADPLCGLLRKAILRTEVV